MATTVQNIIDKVNRHIDDSSEDRVTNSQRFDAISDATSWLQAQLGSDHQVRTKTIDYSDASHYYLTNDIDITNATDMRAEAQDHTVPFTFKSAEDLSVEVASGSGENAYAIDRHDGDTYLIINYNTSHTVQTIADLSDTSDGGGTWVVDDDADNLVADTDEYKEGTGSLQFDIDVSKSANDRATIKNTSLTSQNLADLEDLASWFLYVYIPDSVNTNSVTLRWGDDESNYWSQTVTSNVFGRSLSDGWNHVKFNWEGSSKVGSPDPSAMQYAEVNINYSASQVDDTGYRIDGLRITRTEELTLHFLSWVVGQDSDGSDLYEFSATDDVPFYSGQFDKFDAVVAHKAAADLFDSPLRLDSRADRQDAKAQSKLNRYRSNFPSNRRKESNSFRVGGINFSN